MLTAIQPWKKIIDAKGQRIVGVTKVPLQKIPCSMRECNLGNFVADALVHYFITELSGVNKDPWLDSVVGLVPTGAIRTTLNKGRKYTEMFEIKVIENHIKRCDYFSNILQ